MSISPSQLRRMSALMAGLDEQLARAAEVRMAAIALLRADGWSYDRIAEATGLSESRVAQLSREVSGDKSHRKASRSSST